MTLSGPLSVLLAFSGASARAQEYQASTCRTVFGLGQGTEFGVVSKGDRYAYDAHGLIGFNMGCDGPCASAEPDGNTFQRSDPKARGVHLGELICPRYRIYSLVGKVDGKCLRLGKQGEFKAPASGLLTLYFNDDAYSESHGGWEVCVYGLGATEPPPTPVRRGLPPARPAPRVVARAPDPEPRPFLSESPAPVRMEKPDPLTGANAPLAPPVERAPVAPKPTIKVSKEVDELLTLPPDAPEPQEPPPGPPREPKVEPAPKPEALPKPEGTPETLGQVPVLPERAQPEPPVEKAPEAPVRAKPKPQAPPRRPKGKAEAFAPLPAPAERAAPEPSPEKPLEDAETGPLAFDAVPQLIEYLRKGSRSLRYRAADELARRGPPAAEAVDALIAALRDKEAAVRSSAALALGNMGAAGKRGTRDLERLTRDKNIDVKNSAEFALKRLSQAPAK